MNKLTNWQFAFLFGVLTFGVNAFRPITTSDGFVQAVGFAVVVFILSWLLDQGDPY